MIVAVRPDVWSDLAHPWRDRTIRFWSRELFERDNRLLAIVFQDREIRSRESAYGTAIAIEHGDIERDNIHSAAETRNRLLRILCERQKRENTGESGAHASSMQAGEWILPDARIHMQHDPAGFGVDLQCGQVLE